MVTEVDINRATFDSLKMSGTMMKHGVVMPDEHPTDPSLYKVNFGDITASASGRLEDGIWCDNGMSPFVRFRDINNTPISMGSYTPIAPYMPVTVLMRNGGVGQGTIVGPAKTNVGLPDPENRDHLYMVAQTPKESWIALDDKIGNIQLMFEGGSSSVVLAEDNITLEIGKGDKSGKESVTSLNVSKSGFIFRMRDATMKFDESGFSVGFDNTEEQEHSSSFSITRDSIKAQAGKTMQMNAAVSISAKAEKIAFEGVRDASFVGNQVKINGAQITSIKGNQIELEGFWNVQLKAMHVGVQANIMYREDSSIKYVTNITELNKTSGIAAHRTLSNNTWVTASNLTFAAFNAIYLTPEMVYGSAAVAMGIVSGIEGMSKGVHSMLKEVGQMWMAKTMPVSVVTNILGTGYAMAGAGNRAENPSKFLFNADDTKNKKSMNSGIATSYSRKNAAMENLSVVDPLIQASMTALYTGGSSPASAVNPDTQWALEMGIGGVAEEATQVSGNIIGLDTAGITMTDSVAMLAPNGTCSTLRQGCALSSGSQSAPKCGEDGFSQAKSEQDKATGPFAEWLLASAGGGGSGGSCGGGSGSSGSCGSGGSGGSCGSGGSGGSGGSCGSGGSGGSCGSSGYSNSPCPPGYYQNISGQCVREGTVSGGGISSPTPCTSKFRCGACPSGYRCSEGQCA